MVHRALLLFPLLALSHGAAMWLGGRHPAERKEPVEAVVPARPETHRLELERLLQQGRELAAKKKKEVPSHFLTEVKLAAGKIPQDADFKTLLDAGTQMPDAKLSAGTLATFRVWMAHDPSAALHWYDGYRRQHRYSLLDREIVFVFKNGGLGQLPQFVGWAPQMSKGLVELAASALRESGDVDDALKLAASLQSSADRFTILNDWYSDREVYVGQLSGVRELLDDEDAARFLIGLASPSTVFFLDEARRAGFPANALRHFEKDCVEPRGKINRNNIDALLSGPVTWESLASRSNADFLPVVNSKPSGMMPTVADSYLQSQASQPIPPKLLEEIILRRELLSQGRIKPEELAAWLKEVGPAVPGMARRAVLLTLETGLEADPAATLAWLKSSREDWKQLMTDVGWERLPPEPLMTLAADFPSHSSDAPAFTEALTNAFCQWLWSDPRSCMEAVDRMPDGPFRETLFRLGKGAGQ